MSFIDDKLLLILHCYAGRQRPLLFGEEIETLAGAEADNTWARINSFNAANAPVSVAAATAADYESFS